MTFPQLSLFFFFFFPLPPAVQSEGRVGFGPSLWGHFCLSRAGKHFYFLLRVLNLRFAVSFPSSFCLVLLFHCVFLGGGTAPCSLRGHFFFLFPDFVPIPQRWGFGGCRLSCWEKERRPGGRQRGPCSGWGCSQASVRGSPGSSCPTGVLGDSPCGTRGQWAPRSWDQAAAWPVCAPCQARGICPQQSPEALTAGIHSGSLGPRFLCGSLRLTLCNSSHPCPAVRFQRRPRSLARRPPAGAPGSLFDHTCMSCRRCLPLQGLPCLSHRDGPPS